MSVLNAYSKIKARYPVSTIIFDHKFMKEIIKEDAVRASKVLDIPYTYRTVEEETVEILTIYSSELESSISKLLALGKVIIVTPL